MKDPKDTGKAKPIGSDPQNAGHRNDHTAIGMQIVSRDNLVGTDGSF